MIRAPLVWVCRSAAIASVTFAFSALASTLQLGVSPDCSETKVSLSDLLSIERRPGIRSMVDFLRAIPSSGLQTFTFVYATNSLQHNGVNEKWPRALRMSADGKLSMSFVCNPKSQDYGRVEVLHYESSPRAGWRALTFDFRERQMTAGGLSETEIFQTHGRVHRNSTTCAKCHSPNGRDVDALRPIIPQYKTWTGFYGSDDDVLHLGTTEYAKYLDFLKHARTDPCYGTLPWPNSGIPGYELYPYHEGYDLRTRALNQFTLYEETKRLKIQDYFLRPNLHFTDAYSHLMAERLATKIMQTPEYSAVAPLLMMETADCDGAFVDRELATVLPGYQPPKIRYAETYMDPRTEESRTRNLFGTSLFLGTEISDYTLHFNDSQNPYYNTGAAGANRRDSSIGRMAQGVILREYAKSHPQLTGTFKILRGVSQFFAPQDFSCIDDVAGPIVIDTIEKKESFCREIMAVYSGSEGISARRALAEARASLSLAASATHSTSSGKTGTTAAYLAPLGLDRFIQSSDTVTSLDLTRGRKVFEDQCLFCHGWASPLPKVYHFFESDQKLRASLRENPALLWTAIAYLESGRMPVGAKLQRDEINSLRAYLTNEARAALVQ